MSKSYSVRVTKDHLVFSAGHFITFAGDQCERLHGHNFRVAVEVEGGLDENSYVFDFIALLEMSRGIAAELDHRMLLPDRSPRIRVEPDGENWRVAYQKRFWSFPKDECVVLPVCNTTTELIATYFGDRLRKIMIDRGMTIPKVMRVEVEENFGQWASVEWDESKDGGTAP
jgi:6-pyruvoyltetrahydropterin/6-carboxytetrahydropterin synthase